MCSHIPLKERTQIRKVMLQKWRHKKNGSTVFILSSPKTKRDLFCEQKDWWHENSRAQKWISEDVNLRTITDTLPWYKFSPLNGIRVKPTLHRRRRRIYENLQKPSPVKNYHGIIEQLHFIDQRQAELQNELHVEQKKRHQPYYCNLDRMISGGRILWNVILVCEMILADGKSRKERRFGNPSRTCFVRGENLGRRKSDGWNWRIEKLDASEIFPEDTIRKKS